jgi:hypothetical protein
MNCLRPRQPDRERGAALFLAILVLFILTVMGIALMFTTSIEQTLAGTETKISKVFYAADSGIEYAGAMLSSQVGYAGGPSACRDGTLLCMPVGVSSHYPSLTSPDIEVKISQPVMISYALPPGNPLSSGGHVYGPTAYYEIVYAVTSGATSIKTQASKVIDGEVGIYPKELSIPK